MAIVGAIAVVALLVWKFGLFSYEKLGPLAHQIRSLHDPALAGVEFVGVWAIAGTVGFPAIPMMLLGGVLFGTLAGTALNLVGTALGTSGGYVIARSVVRGNLQRWLERHLPVRELSGRQGFLAVARFRLLPVVPLAVGNFAAGLTRIRYWPYLGGTIAGQLPSTAIYTYFADSMVRAAAAGAGARATATRDVVLISVFFLVVSIVPKLIKWRR